LKGFERDRDGTCGRKTVPGAVPALRDIVMEHRGAPAMQRTCFRPSMASRVGGEVRR
jgi:hypothetical protein